MPLDTAQIVALICAPRVGRKVVHQVLNAGQNFMPSTTRKLQALLLDTVGNAPTEREIENACKYADQVLKNAHDRGIRVLTPNDSDFPSGLRNMPDPPAAIYIKGNTLQIQTGTAVAVVGTRKPSRFGSGSAYKIGAALATEGLTVISGLALGCDAAAQTGCLDAGGHTAAVMAHGLAQPAYPEINIPLSRRILDSGGWLISEYPPWANWRRATFVERDRLQSGLASAVIIIETDVKGGTMHTARYALKQRRLVGCVDHPEKWASHLKTRGNRYLISEANAVPLANKDELTKFIGLFHKRFSDPESAGTAAGTD